jgi:hypothetical protein
MGLFIGMSGVANADCSAVEGALRDYAATKGGTLEPVACPADPFDVLLIAKSGNHVSVVYPGEFTDWEGASTHISQLLDTSVLLLHIHDGDLWMYMLLSKGKAVDMFNPIPGYWTDDMSDEERMSWAGNALVVTQHWPSVQPDAIAKYLVTWNLDETHSAKAYADDEFSYNDCWQMTDFMRRLGLVYPIDDKGKIQATSYRFCV